MCRAEPSWFTHRARAYGAVSRTPSTGGTSGVGLGDGRQKRGFLPESVTDFIFPNVGEEFGLWGALLVVLLFALILLAGMSIAHHAPERFSRLLGFGITWG